MISSTRLAVFDVDGTIIDSQHNIVASMQSACETSGIAAPGPAAIRAIIGLSLPVAVARLLPDLDPQTLEIIAEAYKRCFLTRRQNPDHEEPMFPGAMRTIDALAADGWLLAVATGKSRRGLLAMLDHHGLQGRFMSLQTADDNPTKPHPAMLQKAMAEAGALASETVMIGDTSYDMQMGREAGARSIGVGWGYHPEQALLEAGAERVVASYDELLPVLTHLFDPVS